MIRWHFIFVLFTILLVGCQPIIEWKTPVIEKRDHPATMTARLTETPEISVKEVCSIVYGNDLVLGKTSFSEAEKWLQKQGITYNVGDDRDRISWDNPEYIDITLLFHNDSLYGAFLWKRSSRPLLGQIVNGLGAPEYFVAGLANNATPVGACENNYCAVSITLGYPSQGVEFSTLFGTDKQTITITPDYEMEMIDCYEPGRREEFEQNQYGTVFSYDQGLQWRGFGMKVSLSK